MAERARCPRLINKWRGFKAHVLLYLFYFIFYVLKPKGCNWMSSSGRKNRCPQALVAAKVAMKIVQVSSVCRVVAKPWTHKKTMLPSSQVVLLLHTHSAYQIRREGKRKKGEGEEVERWPWICLRFRVEYWEGTMAHGRGDGPTLWCCPNKISMIFGWRYCGTLA